LTQVVVLAVEVMRPVQAMVIVVELAVALEDWVAGSSFFVCSTVYVDNHLFTAAGGLAGQVEFVEIGGVDGAIDGVVLGTGFAFIKIGGMAFGADNFEGIRRVIGGGTHKMSLLFLAIDNGRDCQS
jgi:hypothetical protein